VTDVVAALEELAGVLAWPEDDGVVTARAIARLRPRRRWPMALGIGVAAAAAVALPAAAGLVGVPGIRIVRASGPLPSDVGATLSLGRPVDVPLGAPSLSGLGRPSAVYTGVPEGATTYVWEDGDELVLFTSFPGAVSDDLFVKQVHEGTTVEAVDVGDAAGWWVGGEQHVLLYVAPDGEVHADQLRLSEHALVWTVDGTTHRLETARELRDALRWAEALG
jgi:hypothetical protein